MTTDSDDSDRYERRSTYGPDGSLSVDAVLDLLAHPFRRELLQYVADSTTATATLDDVTTHLHNQDGWQTDDRPDRDQIEVALEHTHLPKLTETGILEYDPCSRELRYRGDERLEAMLECLRSMERV
ncbi:DUF7344 domain-containing protein [Natrinema salsiterrestre]|uniref:DUF7344 domain-containing protein n=1 Tax=Natrinema salsiterrestre TaxID=2950540 RepID=A0A9Q4L6M2_9EURY|nr:hypothetical protein [Natrinema salsiterrestre]MDF9748494.1 hypothetical protein [Natrinema salsiterrestre]